MEFGEFKKLLRDHFKQMTESESHIFQVELDKDRLWSLYLDSFPSGTNNIYRVRREFDCSCCRQFVKTVGNVVAIKNNKVETIWDFDTQDSTYQPVVDALARYVKSMPVTDVYISKFGSIGTDRNFDTTPDTLVSEWQHLHIFMPSTFVDKSHRSLGEIQGAYRDTRNVFKRSLDEISEESLLTVLELISQNSLYRGEEWKDILGGFLSLKIEYKNLPSYNEQDNYAWAQSVKLGGAVGRIRNHSIGTLLVDISEGENLDVAVRKYESIVAPSNYKRPQAIFTQRMLDEAKKKIEELGYMESLSRRYACLDDITVNNILFSNRDVVKRISGANVFDEISMGLPTNPKIFSKIEEVAIDDFVTKLLPLSSKVEVFLENKHQSNFVSLIAPENKDAPSMLKWRNSFSWAYSGNITDSNIKENVKSAGGDVNGVLRFSIQWNDGKEHDPNDLDAHCIQPRGREIYFISRHDLNTLGELDVDIVHPQKGVPAVENITWPLLARMQEGVYSFFVYGYSNRGGREGFKAEVEFDGQIFSFDYNKTVREGERVDVARVTYDGLTGFQIKEMLPSSVSSKEIWNLKTNQFVPVSVIMYSPNYWDEQSGIGNRHYFFMLKDCVNPEKPNGFYNEFLKEDLLKHKHVFEALGGKMAVKDTKDQLSGLGFSSTKRNELVVKVTGQSERVIKIKF